MSSVARTVGEQTRRGKVETALLHNTFPDREWRGNPARLMFDHVMFGLPHRTLHDYDVKSQVAISGVKYLLFVYNPG